MISSNQKFFIRCIFSSYAGSFRLPKESCFPLIDTDRSIFHHTISNIGAKNLLLRSHFGSSSSTTLANGLADFAIWQGFQPTLEQYDIAERTSDLGIGQGFQPKPEPYDIGERTSDLRICRPFQPNPKP